MLLPDESITRIPVPGPKSIGELGAEYPQEAIFRKIFALLSDFCDLNV